MSRYVANRETEIELQSIHDGLQIALEKLTAARDTGAAVRLLRDLDAKIGKLLDAIQPPR